MKKIIILGIVLLLHFGHQNAKAQSTQQLTALQYYFDTDPGQGIAGNGSIIPIAPTVNYNQTVSINIGSLSEGIHHLYVRVKNQADVWSIIERRMLYLQNVNLQVVKNLIAYEYYFDNDPGVGNGDLVAITPTTNFNQNIAVNVPALSEGIHHLYIRVKNEEGTWSIVERKMLYLQNVNLLVEKNIIAYEYYFDNDPGEGNGNLTSITPTTNFNQNIAVNVPAMNEGIHHLYMRVKNEEGTWSIVERKMLYLQNVNLLVEKNIIAYEYYFDNDPGVGNGNLVAITPTTNFNQNIAVNVPALNEGIHHLYMRVKNEEGTWSIVERKMLYLQNVNLQVAKNLIAYEYYFDNDPGVGNGNLVAITPTTNFNQNIAVNVPALSEGIHHLYIRVKNEEGTWSVVERRMIYINLQDNFETPKIVAMEYYFDNDPGVGLGISFPITAATNIETVASISPLSLSLGNHFLYFRAKDSLGRWSIVERNLLNVSTDSLHLKFYVEGYYVGGGTMRQVLLNQGQQIDPFTTDVDTFAIEFRDTISPYVVMNSFKGILQTDGSLHCMFPYHINYDSYYVVIKGRNNIAAWSATPLLHADSNFNFTVSNTNAYGNNMREVEPNVWAIYSGDLNADENIDLLDIGLLEDDINTFQFGYFATDINGDGNVDLLDAPIVEDNVNGFIFSVHP